MSLILDALKKADKERQAGQVPTILFQDDADPSILLANATSSTRYRQWLTRATCIALVTLLLGGIVWQRQSDFKLSRTGSSSTAVVPLTASKMPVQVVKAPDASVKTNEALAEAGETAITALQVPVPVPIVAPKPPVKSITQREAQPKAQSKMQSPALETTAPTQKVRVLELPLANKALVQKAVVAASPLVSTLAQLPPQIRSEIAPITLSGSIYSTDPKERLLLVDKRMLREGDEIAPGLMLESILQKGAILRYKDYRFKIVN